MHGGVDTVSGLRSVGLRFREAARPALDLLFPRTCLGCGVPDPDPHRFFCWDCRSAFRFVQPPSCRRCGDPVSGRIDHTYICSACTRRAPGFDAARSVLRDHGPAAEAVRALKYGAQTWLAADLADFLIEGFRTYYGREIFDGVCPVPLYRTRLLQRGFNQASLLAEPLARAFDLEWNPRALRRVRPTPSQTRLTAAERAHNVRGAFRSRPRARSWIAGRRLLLVDDVMTTGATADACARALKTSGAARVHVLTLVRR